MTSIQHDLERFNAALREMRRVLFRAWARELADVNRALERLLKK